MSAPDDPRPDHAEWDALAVGWALSALDAEDEARFAAHLSGCDRCAETVRESLGTVADLAYAMPAVTPPRQLKRRILEAAAAEPRRPAADPDLAGAGNQVAFRHRQPDGSTPAPDHPARPRTADDHRPVDDQPADDHRPAYARRPAPGDRTGTHRPPDLRTADEHPAAAPPPSPGDRTGTHRPPDHRTADAPPPGERTADVVPIGARRRWVARTAVAAGLALIAGLGVWNVELRSRQDDLRQIVAQRDALVARLTEQGPADITIIQNPDDAGSRYATVVVKGGRIGLITETLPPLSGDTTYWLWSLRSPNDTSPVPLAGFTVPSTRFSACNIEPPAGADTIRTFAISEEPGSRRPTTPTDVIGLGQAPDS